MIKITPTKEAAPATGAARESKPHGQTNNSNECSQTQKPSKRLADFRVTHTDTIGMSWQEIDALRPLCVVKQFGRRGELMLLAAESKSRKSWLVQDLAFCVALGVPWLRDENGEGGFDTTKATVHVFDLELDASEMRFRLAKARANWTPDTAEQAKFTENMVHYSLDGVQSLDVLAYLDELKQTVAAGDLVVVDCLYRLQADGNETELIANAMQTLKDFAKQTQALVVLVDHFRKAGAEKSRDRIAGTFVKSASASTIVAIEVDAEKILQMQIDARTFHGCDRVQARFDLDTYRFIQVADTYASEKIENECHQWIVDLWKSHDHEQPITLRGAMAKWQGTGVNNRQGANKRLKRLEKLLWIVSKSDGQGKAMKFYLTAVGLAKVKGATEAVAPVAPELLKAFETL